ncbi:MAG: phosphotransferase [Candidatus Nanoarchaeia archaeon]
MQDLNEYIHSLPPSIFGETNYNNIDINKLASGCYNVNYLVKINNKHFVFRQNIHSDEQEGGQLEKEYETLKKLDGLHAPKPLYFRENILIEEFIQGEKITKLTDKLIRRIAKALAKVHKHKISVKSSSLKKYYENLFESRQNTLQKNQKISAQLKPFIKKAKEYIHKKNSRFNEIKKTRLLHGDMHCGNILKSGSDVVFLDWENTGAGEPAFDIVAFFYESENLQYFQNSITDKQKELFIKEYLKHNFDQNLREKIDIIYPLRWLSDTLWLASRIINYEQLPEEAREKSKGEYERLYNLNIIKLKKLWL